MEIELASKAVNIKELTTYISLNWLQGVLRSSLREFERTGNINKLLQNIERAFYLELWEQKITNLDNRSRSIAEKVIGIEIDLNNIGRILRQKILHIEPVFIKEQIIPIYFKLKMYMNDLINSTSFLHALSVLDSTFYSDLAGALRRSHLDRKSIEMLDQIQQEYFLRSLTSIMAGYPFHLGILLSYYFYNRQSQAATRHVLKIRSGPIKFFEHPG